MRRLRVVDRCAREYHIVKHLREGLWAERDAHEVRRGAPV